MEDRAKLLATVRRQGAGFAGWGALGSPFYAGLCDELAVDVERDGPVARVIAPFGDAEFEAAYVLRLLGGVHRMVLAGAAPDLAAHYPSVGGDGDAHAAFAVMRALLDDPPETVLDALASTTANQRGGPLDRVGLGTAGDRGHGAYAAEPARDRCERWPQPPA